MGEVTKDQFDAYVRVQKSGVTNMLDVKRVEALSGVPRATVMQIIREYGQLADKYGREG